MGKSENNGIFPADSDEAIRKKVMRAVTDSGPTEPDSPLSEGVAQHLHHHAGGVRAHDRGLSGEQYAPVREIRYGDLKKQLAERTLSKAIAPIRERIEAIKGDEAYLRREWSREGPKARASASLDRCRRA